MAKTMSIEDQIAMWGSLKELQDTFPYTEEGLILFGNYCLNKLVRRGPDLTYSQADILRFLFNNGTKMVSKKKKKGKKVKYKSSLVSSGVGKRLRMIQANRGLGKTTLTAIYAVFRIIHDPTTRVLIFSAGGDLAKQISHWVIQIFKDLSILSFMNPDERNGDRSSTENFDIHWVLRGSEKSPSVKCKGTDTHSQGLRADLLIADDIESLKNAKTEMMREKIIDLTREFESICQSGDIVYLGTPQFFNSIYNGLPSRGFDIRIWPARYPNTEEISSYGGYLAPFIYREIDRDPSLQTGYGIGGVSGAPVTPEMFSDELLIEKEISQTSAKFQLQYMLNTRLADAERYPLKLNNLVFSHFNNKKGIVSPIWCTDDRNQISANLYTTQDTDKLYRELNSVYETRDFERSLMYLDPSGGGKNGDETGYAVIRTLGSYIYVQEIGGVKGGYEEKQLTILVDIAKRCDIKEIWYEDNYGKGALAAVLKPLFQKNKMPVSLTPHWVTGQKETRMIDTLEPLVSSHRLVINPEVIGKDLSSVEKYATEERFSFSFFSQMSMITRDRDCLVHDDRLDALAGACSQVVEIIQYDNETEMNRRREKEYNQWRDKFSNPTAYRDEIPISQATRTKTLGSLCKSRGW